MSVCVLVYSPITESADEFSFTHRRFISNIFRIAHDVPHVRCFGAITKVFNFSVGSVLSEGGLFLLSHLAAFTLISINRSSP